MRRSWDTAARSALRSSSAWPSWAATSAWRREPARLDRRAELRRERPHDVPVLGRDRRPRQREHHAVADGHGLGRRRPARPAAPRRPAASTRQPPAPSRDEHADGLERERVAQVLHEGGQRIDARRRPPRAGPASRPPPATGSPRSIAAPTSDTNDDTTSPDEDEHREGDDVVAVADRPRVQRREEEPVGVQRRADRGDDGRARRRRSRPRATTTSR